MPTNFDLVGEKIVPRSQLHRIPKGLSRFFGHRHEGEAAISAYERNFWTLISTFAGLTVVMVIFNYAPYFVQKNVPVITPNWGASAILIYNVFQAPLAQPRNVVVGTMLSSIIGVGLCKLWMTSSSNEQYLWLAGALATAISSVLMSVTNSVHPPAGAAALIPCVVPEVREIGWYYLATQILTAVIMLTVALIFNNIRQRYPMYWWLPSRTDSSKV